MFLRGPDGIVPADIVPVFFREGPRREQGKQSPVSTNRARLSFKARRFQDEVFLYPVLNAAGRPGLYRIQNPAVILPPEEQVEVRYLIALTEILSKSEQQVRIVVYNVYIK